MSASLEPIEKPQKNEIVQDGDVYRFLCPNCLTSIVEVEKKQINCTIFRCGVIKATQKQIPPHEKKAECDRLRENDLIWGCARPFKFDGTKVEKCGYI